MMRLIPAVAAALCLASFTPVPSLAQEDAVSLREASLALRAQVRAAAGIEDWESAKRANAAALALQPGHPGLLNNQLVLSRLSGDQAGMLDALDAMAAHGLIFDLSGLAQADDLLALDSERFAAIEADLRRNASPVGEGRLVAEPPLRDALIEALAVDNETERLYLGSVADRRIYRMEPFDPEEAEIFAGEDAPIGSIFGLAIDRRNGILYAAEGAVDITPREDGEEIGTALLALDLETGEIIARHTIDGAARIGDVVVRDGIVYASDADAGRIYRLNGPRAGIELYAEDARFVSLQGLAPARAALFVADYTWGLWRIDPVSRNAQLLETPPGASLIGLDGLVADRTGRLFVIRNGAAPYGVFELEFDRSGALSALTPVLVNDVRLGEPTTVRIADDRAFLLNDAQWALFEPDADASARTDPMVLSVPLPSP
jgi:hypothetical protein